MLGVSRSDCRIWRAWAAKALLASVCVLKGAGGSWTKLPSPSTPSRQRKKGGRVPDGQGEDGPHHPRLEGAVADAQQQGRGVVEAPFVAAAQVAVLDLVREQVEGVDAVEGGCRRVGRGVLRCGSGSGRTGAGRRPAGYAHALP